MGDSIHVDSSIICRQYHISHFFVATHFYTSTDNGISEL